MLIYLDEPILITCDLSWSLKIPSTKSSEKLSAFVPVALSLNLISTFIGIPVAIIAAGVSTAYGTTYRPPSYAVRIQSWLVQWQGRWAQASRQWKKWKICGANPVKNGLNGREHPAMGGRWPILTRLMSSLPLCNIVYIWWPLLYQRCCRLWNLRWQRPQRPWG